MEASYGGWIEYVVQVCVTHVKREIKRKSVKRKNFSFHSQTSFPAFRIKEIHAVSLLYGTQTGPVLWSMWLAADSAHFSVLIHTKFLCAVC